MVKSFRFTLAYAIMVTVRLSLGFQIFFNSWEFVDSSLMFNTYCIIQQKYLLLSVQYDGDFASESKLSALFQLMGVC